MLMWDTKFSTGIELIDTHHIELMRIINELHGIKKSRESDLNMKYTFLELMHFAGYHFARQEKLMLHSSFPDAAEHRIEHFNFRKHLDNILEDTADGIIQVDSHFLEYLAHWQQMHIQEMDITLGKFLSSAGYT